MLRWMFRKACLGFLVGATALAWGAPGRVVRVERPRTKAVPRLCDVQPMAKEGLCVGQPNNGDRISLIDQERGIAIGEFRIDSALGVADPFVCAGAAPVVYKMKGALITGDVDVIAGSGRIIGLRNLTLDPKVARVVKGQTEPGGTDLAELALDTDGNDTVDYMLVRYACDESNTRVTNNDRRFCFDTYLERGKKLVKVHTDNIQICY
jgi:hypothetical protein